MYFNDFEEQITAWPKPIVLTHLGGDTFFTLIQHPHCIEARWSGHITADDVITASKVYLSVLQKCHTPRLYNDKTGATGDWQEANDWLEFEWMPKAVQAGLRCLAHVYSDNMFSRLSARDLYARLTPNLQMQNFHNQEEAWEWLKGCVMKQVPGRNPRTEAS